MAALPEAAVLACGQLGACQVSRQQGKGRAPACRCCQPQGAQAGRVLGFWPPPVLAHAGGRS